MFKSLFRMYGILAIAVIIALGLVSFVLGVVYERRVDSMAVSNDSVHVDMIFTGDTFSFDGQIFRVFRDPVTDRIWLIGTKSGVNGAEQMFNADGTAMLYSEFLDEYVR